MFLWIGHNADPEWIQSVFGVQSAAQIDIDKVIFFGLFVKLTLIENINCCRAIPI